MNYFTYIEAVIISNFLSKPNNKFSKDNRLASATSLLQMNALNSNFNKIFLQLSDVHNLSDIYESFILNLFCWKYNQNIDGAEERFYAEVQKGQLFYHSKGKKVKVFLRRQNDNVYFAPFPKDKHSTEYSYTTEVVRKMLRLVGQTEANYTRTTPEYVQKYLNFLNNHLPDSLVLSSFPKKVIILSRLNLAENIPELDSLPIQVGSRVRMLPVEPLIKIYNDADTAFMAIREQEQSDFVYIGNNFEDVLTQVGNYQVDGKIDKIIVVSTRSIPNDYGFKKWAWSRQETEYLQNNELGTFEKIAIKYHELARLKADLTEVGNQMIEKGAAQNSVQSMVNYLLAGYSNYAIIDKVKVLEYQKSWVMGDEDPIANLLFDASNAEVADIKSHIVNILQSYDSISPKLDWILNIVQNFKIDPNLKEVLIIVPKWQVEQWNEYIREYPRVKVITNQELRSILKNPPAEFLKESKLFWKKRLIIVPHISFDYQHIEGPLHSYDLYQKARQLGNVAWLYYDQIEEERVKAFEVFDQRILKYRQTHPDRSLFLPDYQYQWKEESKNDEMEQESQGLIVTIEESQIVDNQNNITEYAKKLNDYFSKYFGVWKPNKRLRESGLFSNDDGEDEELNPRKSIAKLSKIKYRLWFSEKDDDYEDWGENEIVGVKMGSNLQIQATKVSLLQNEQSFLDFELSLDIAWGALKTIPEAQENLKEIIWASKEWRKWLEKCFEYYTLGKKLSENEAIKSITEKSEVSVDKATVQQWRQKKSEYFFPRKIEDLDKILNLRIRQSLPDKHQTMQVEAERIRNSRGQSASYREVITKLKAELSYYKLSQQKGDFLSRLDEKHLNDLLKTQTFKRIYKIEKLP